MWTVSIGSESGFDEQRSTRRGPARSVFGANGPLGSAQEATRRVYGGGFDAQKQGIHPDSLLPIRRIYWELHTT